MVDPHMPDWNPPQRGRRSDRVARVPNTDLLVTFDETFDRVYLHRGEGIETDDAGDTLIMNHAEWASLVGVAQQLHHLATPHWWGTHQQTQQDEPKGPQMVTQHAMQLVSLTARSEGGWEWEASDPEDGRVTRYRTDRDCEGLWVWLVDSGWKQTKGHLQAVYPPDRAGMLRHLELMHQYDVSQVPAAE